MSDFVKKYLTCPVCLELFKSPKILPCVHSFCDSCLNEYVRNRHVVSMSGRVNFECPVCRSTTDAGREIGHYGGDIDLNSSTGWTKKFAPNHHLVALLDDVLKQEGVENSSRNKLNKKCQGCFTAGRGSCASGLCIQCFEFLCDYCQINHKLFKPSRNHTVLKKEELPDISLLKRMYKLGLCEVHQDEEIILKFKDEFKCTTCIPSTQIDHYSKSFETISDWEKNLACKDAKSKMVSLKEKIETVMIEKKDNIKELKNELVLKEHDRAEFMSHLKDMVDSAEEMHQILKTHVQTEKKMLAVAVKKCANLIEQADDEIDFIDVVSKYGSDVQGVVLGKNVDVKGKKIEFDLEKQSSVKARSLDEFLMTKESRILKNIRSVIDDRLEELRKNYRVTAADYEDKFIVKFLNYARKGSSEFQNKVTLRESRKDSEEPRFTCRLWKIVKDGAYNISVSASEMDSNNNNDNDDGNKKVCSHTGCFVFEDGDMVFLDKSNSIIKLVNAEFEVLDHLQLEGSLVDMAFIGNGEFAVVSSEKILVYYVHENDNQMRLKSGYNMNYGCIKSLCALGENLLVLFSDDADEDKKSHIIEMNRQGKIQKEMENLDCSNVSCVRSRNQDDIVTGGQDIVRIFDKNGQEKWWFRRCFMKNVVNVSFDSQDNIYICDEDHITMVSPNEYSNFRIVTSELPKPACVTINPITGTIIIGCINDNFVHVYKLVCNANQEQ